MKGAALLLVCAIGAASMAGCASRAAASATVPLETPEPPPRVALDPLPSPIEEPEPTAPVEPPPVRTAQPSPVPPAAPATPPASSQPALGPFPEPPRTSHAPELQPAPPAGRATTAAQVRDRIGRARQKLDAIDARRLNTGRRADYDSARRFLAQAESAARDNNLLLAESSVEKAETLADGLR